METNTSPAARLRLPDETIQLYPEQRVTLGRGSENDIVLSDPKISRVHAVLEWIGNGFAIRDLDSANGTYVNSKRLTATAYPLHDGDTILLSRQPLIYEIIRVETGEVPVVEESISQSKLLSGPLLMVTAGPDQGQRYTLWGEVITIGRASRDATWEIRLTDRSVSRPHARLERVEDGYVLFDLGSANGTTLNGAPVEGQVPVRNGDVIGVGESQVVFLAHEL